MTSSVELKIHGDVAEIRVVNPPVNALSRTVRGRLVEVLAGVDQLGVRIAILTGGRERFVAGADIAELDKPIDPPDLLDIEAVIAQLATPVIAAVEGRALGGGFLLALMCDLRVVHRNSSFGFPEVSLGLLPTFAGTRIPPRMCEPAFAARLIAYGEKIDALTALRAGLIDEISPEDDVAAFAGRLQVSGKRRTLSLPPPPTAARAQVEAVITSVAAEKRGFLAPETALRSMLFGLDAPLEAALENEARLFEALRVSAQSKLLRTLFFVERSASRSPAPQAGATRGFISAPGLMVEQRLLGFSPAPTGVLTYDQARAHADSRSLRLVTMPAVHLGETMSACMSAAIARMNVEADALVGALREAGFSAVAAKYWSRSTAGRAPAQLQAKPIIAALRRALRECPDLRDAAPAAVNLLSTWVLGWPRWDASIFGPD